MIIWIDAEKAFDRQHPVMVKIVNKLSIENFLSLIKGIYENPRANIILMAKDWILFLLRSGIRQRMALFSVTGNKKEIKDIHIGKEEIKLYPQWYDLYIKS